MVNVVIELEKYDYWRKLMLQMVKHKYIIDSLENDVEIQD